MLYSSWNLYQWNFFDFGMPCILSHPPAKIMLELYKKLFEQWQVTSPANASPPQQCEFLPPGQIGTSKSSSHLILAPSTQNILPGEVVPVRLNIPKRMPLWPRWPRSSHRLHVIPSSAWFHPNTTMVKRLDDANQQIKCNKWNPATSIFTGRFYHCPKPPPSSTRKKEYSLHVPSFGGHYLGLRWSRYHNGEL